MRISDCPFRISENVHSIVNRAMNYPIFECFSSCFSSASSAVRTCFVPARRRVELVKRLDCHAVFDNTARDVAHVALCKRDRGNRT